MADRDRPHPHQVIVHPQHRHEGGGLQSHYRNEGGGMKHFLPQNGPSTGQILAVITLLPVTGTLLGLAGIMLIGTLIGLAIATPLFVIFSPILVPAAILIAGAVTAVLTSGAFGLTGLSSLSWVLSSFRQATGQGPLEYATRKAQEATVQVGEATKQVGEVVGEKTKQVGETIKTKAQPTEGGR
ncbi:hypothetical protein ACJIZ3_015083 [Penstemon smallii]|uniref:Oleosin n=1 Tax=Penstemon smallii TaxID=265156 RepID=A0ABD3RLH0_9LAMI